MVLSLSSSPYILCCWVNDILRLWIPNTDSEHDHRLCFLTLNFECKLKIHGLITVCAVWMWPMCLFRSCNEWSWCYVYIVRFWMDNQHLLTGMSLEMFCSTAAYSSVTNTVYAATATDMQRKQTHILLPVPITTVTEVISRWQRL